ncbi:MAG TPA: hypothetical protein VF591_22310 [Pyrinomonadaceae bacterium]|jgi:hypothetical protein
MALRALEGQRFVRRTQLSHGEYRKNFRQIDCDILAAVTSVEADAVTPLMSKVYLRLANAHERFWERDGVLRIEAEPREEKVVKAWTVLCELVGVSSATASKALRWMHEQGIIGYFSGKNGVGLRIFLNRAASSIGVRNRQSGEKILAFPPASSGEAPASADEPAFNAPFGGLENSDKDKKPRAPKIGADDQPVGHGLLNEPTRLVLTARPATPPVAPAPTEQGKMSLEAVVSRLRAEIEPRMQEVAREAAAREHARTREWLENKGLPKAARVAQHETYNVLKRHGVIDSTPRRKPDISRNDGPPPEPRPLSDEEVRDLAEAAVAMLEIQGRPVEATLAQMSTTANGFLLPDDSARVRARVNSLLIQGDGEKGR